MSLAQRFERRLEGLVGGAFARVFKGHVEPVEIGSALQREAADKKSVMGHGQVQCPNRYRVTLSPEDHTRLVPWEIQLTSSLAELVQEYLDENRWSTIGDIEVYLALDEGLHTGVFGVASRMEPQAPPRRRPHDSLSMPVVGAAPPGHHPPPGAYPAAAVPAAYAQPYLQRAPAQQQPYPQQPYPQNPYPQQGDPQQPYPQSPGERATASVVVDQTNQRHELRIGSNVVGRGTDADVQLLDQGVSRRHLDIQFDGSYATVYDLGSTNGTSVNGHEVGSQVLRHGDVVRLGHTRLVFHQEPS
ncbi:MAG: FhaA domain-containing protein [Jatrophihabitantaceae bacterium]